VGVGTVYNYFPSKEELLAMHMLRDWNQCIAVLAAVSEASDVPEPVVRGIYDQLREYAARHAVIFRDESAATAFAGSFRRYHGLLRSQLSQPLRKFCESDFLADFLAESLLTWTMAGKSFEEIYGILQKLL
jgi:AcrR family transcriptional regulator